MSPILYGGLVAYEVDQSQAGVRSIWLGHRVDSLGGTAIGNYVGHGTTEGEALKMGYDLACLAGLARAPWRLTNAGEIVADSSALARLNDNAPSVQLYSYFEGARDVSRPFTTSSGRLYLSSHAPGPWLTEPGILAKARRFMRTGRVSP